jgi:hypothetical protein
VLCCFTFSNKVQFLIMMSAASTRRRAQPHPCTRFPRRRHRSCSSPSVAPAAPGPHSTRHALQQRECSLISKTSTSCAHVLAFMLKLFFAVCAVAAVLGVPVLQQHRDAIVVMHVFSSTSDPSWTLSSAQIEKLRSIFPLAECWHNVRYPNVGYQGFSINGNTIKGCAPLERFLLSTCTASLKPQVTAYVASQLDLIAAASSNTLPNLVAIDSILLPRPLAPAPHTPTLPLRGPDTVPAYDPKDDVQGHFISHQTQNNCYNYANDVATDTFAQPGRGSGQKWSFDTCADINASAIRDGLQWVGTEMPAAPPAVGHHMVRARGLLSCSVGVTRF